jgi:hypothetical protein
MGAGAGGGVFLFGTDLREAVLIYVIDYSGLLID